MARPRLTLSQRPKHPGRLQEAAAAVKERRFNPYEGVLPSRPVVVISEDFERLQVPQRLQQRPRPYPLRSQVSQEIRTKLTNRGKGAEEALAQEAIRISIVDAEVLQEDAIEIAGQRKRTIAGQVEIVGRDLKRNESRHDLTEKEETMEAAGMTVPGLTETEIVKAIEAMAEERAEHTRVLLDAEPTRVRLVTGLSWLALS